LFVLDDSIFIYWSTDTAVFRAKVYATARRATILTNLVRELGPLLLWIFHAHFVVAASTSKKSTTGFTATPFESCRNRYTNGTAEKSSSQGKGTCVVVFEDRIRPCSRASHE